MRLSELLEALDDYEIVGSKKVELASVTNDSRDVKEGSIFVAIRGLRSDGHEFIKDAVSSGAVAVVGDRKLEDTQIRGFSYIKVENSRKALGLLASRWYGNPSKKLKVIGVTGTDGKTTTSSIIYWILKSLGKSAGLINTVSSKIGNKEYDTGLHVTNPDPLLLQKLLFKMVSKKAEYAVLEVTSHGIHQERVAGLEFDIATLTNITHEHIDYHETLTAYKEVKSRLFVNAKACVLNKDDDSFDYIKKRLGKRKRILSYSLEDKNCDLYAKKISKEDKYTKFILEINKKSYEVAVPLQGVFNVSNVLASIGVCYLFDIDIALIPPIIKKFPGVPGRMERVKNSKMINIYIDFAHTPNSLRNVLDTLKKDNKGRLIVVFGCGGERDISKRPMMGEIAGRLADISVFTAEDPRSEDAEAIIKQMVVGAKGAGAEEVVPGTKNFDEAINRSEKVNDKLFLRIPERGEAITFAINKLAEKGDTVIICGKGHEKSMAYNGKEYPWSDRQAVKRALKGEVKKIKR